MLIYVSVSNKQMMLSECLYSSIHTWIELRTYPGESSSSNITVSTPNAWIALFISATLPDPIYVLGFGVDSLQNEK